MVELGLFDQWDICPNCMNPHTGIKCGCRDRERVNKLRKLDEIFREMEKSGNINRVVNIESPDKGRSQE